MKPVASLPCWFVIALGVAATAAANDETVLPFAETVQKTLRTYCFDCHGDATQEAQLRFDTMQGYRRGDQHLWTTIHEQLSGGEMPPEDEAQPSDADRNAVLRWIETQQRATTGGQLRRLNRRELAAALQDVTGLSVNYADALPGDGKVNGFDTGADGLQDAADSIKQIMTVTRRAVDGIYFSSPPASKSIAVDFREVKDPRKAFDPWKEDGVSAKIRGHHFPDSGLWMEPRWLGEKDSLDIYVPVPTNRSGIVRLKMTIAAVKPYAETPNPIFWVEVGAKKIDYREVIGTIDTPQELTYEVQIDDLAAESKGLKISLVNRVEVPYAIDGFANDEKGKPDKPISMTTFRPLYDRKKTPPEKTPAPFVALQSMEIELNYKSAWPPAEWDVAVEDAPDEQQQAEQLLTLWMDRAWRRPTEKSERQRFVALYERLRKQGFSFDDALRAAFQAALMSSEFRYLAATSDKDPTIAQHAIASRLSFMLVGAPPDAELRELAAAGGMRDPNVLDAQVDRLLSDPRSDAFVRPFVMQWLVMDQPITIVMDYFEQQSFRFGRYLKSSMREETIQYVARMFRDNRPARELIDSDWTMMNESLAIHYGYEDVEGGELRVVSLRRDDPRGGGVLSHAGIQSMLCWMGENWVIYRGAWAMRHILDDPPPSLPWRYPNSFPPKVKTAARPFGNCSSNTRRIPSARSAIRRWIRSVTRFRTLTSADAGATSNSRSTTATSWTERLPGAAWARRARSTRWESCREEKSSPPTRSASNCSPNTTCRTSRAVC